MSEYFDIKAACPTMEAAILIMIKGIKHQFARDDFRIKLHSFGSTTLEYVNDGMGRICIGCAATCTVQQIAQVNLGATTITYSDTRAKALHMDHWKMRQFELAIEGVRLGNLKSLFSFYYNGLNDTSKYSALITLSAAMKASNFTFALLNDSFSYYSMLTPEQREEVLTRILRPFQWLVEQCKELQL
jgi:hypothetical protein